MTMIGRLRLGVSEPVSSNLLRYWASVDHVDETPEMYKRPCAPPRLLGTSLLFLGYFFFLL